MRLARPALTHRSASAPVHPTPFRPVGEQTLNTLQMLRNMGYKEVWCQAADINEDVLERAAAQGWRVGSLSEGRIKMVLGPPPSPLTPAAHSPGGTAPAGAFAPKPVRPGYSRKPSEQDIPTRATTPPFREPSPSPTARLAKGQMSPAAAALIASTQVDNVGPDPWRSLNTQNVLSPGTQHMYMRTQKGHSRKASQQSHGSQSSSKSRMPAVVVSPPADDGGEQGGYGDYFSYVPRAPLPPVPVQRRTESRHKARQDSGSSHYTIDDIAEDLLALDVRRPFAAQADAPESPDAATPLDGRAKQQVSPDGIRFETEQRRPIQQRLHRALGPGDDSSYIFLPSTPQAQPGSPRRPSAPPPARDVLAVQAQAITSSRSDPGHGDPPHVATPPAVDPNWNGLNRKQTPHHRRR